MGHEREHLDYEGTFRAHLFEGSQSHYFVRGPRALGPGCR
jgi:hypothetical protein